MTRLRRWLCRLLCGEPAPKPRAIPTGNELAGIIADLQERHVKPAVACERCGQEIRYARSENGAEAFDPDGKLHRWTCPAGLAPVPPPAGDR